MTNVSETAKARILKFVDSFVPDGGTEVWLTGSRAKGDVRPDSDWDVLVITPYAPSPEMVFDVGTQESPYDLEGGPIRVATARREFLDEPGQYTGGLRKYGIRLR